MYGVEEGKSFTPFILRHAPSHRQRQVASAIAHHAQAVFGLCAVFVTQDAFGEVVELDFVVAVMIIVWQHSAEFDGLDPPFCDFCWGD